MIFYLQQSADRILLDDHLHDGFQLITSIDAPNWTVARAYLWQYVPTRPEECEEVE